MDHIDPASAFSDDDEEREAEIAFEEWVDEIETLLGGTSRKKEAKQKQQAKEQRAQKETRMSEEMRVQRAKEEKRAREREARGTPTQKRGSWIKQLVKKDATEPVRQAQSSSPVSTPSSTPASTSPPRRSPPAALLNAPPLPTASPYHAAIASQKYSPPAYPPVPASAGMCGIPYMSTPTHGLPSHQPISSAPISTPVSGKLLPPRAPAPCGPLPNRPIPDVPTDCDDSLVSARLSEYSLPPSLMLPPAFIPAREYYGAPCAYAVAQK
ncbi:hypothetical protein MCUN1_001832 [Malassezia cuniculi]|uniref:Uncharacterized protein n=1 Tax=Malassezia cuniculi TaxID=948313 RepID=A0AAF0ER28_9BASI|nr:hypothetical protein MCUN1_001832 [Malassezia cuniculi]